jgi:hypothetical protein
MAAIGNAVAKRRLLTSKFVQLALPPTQGEQWFADTKLRGFGLRLWATKSGGNKAFAIRIVNLDGKLVRKAFTVNRSRRVRSEFAHGGRKNAHGLGDYLEAAREWARDEIAQARGALTVRQRDDFEKRVAGDHVKEMTLADAAQSLIAGMRANGRSQRYLDRLDKLFSNNVTTRLKKTPLQRISAKSVARCLIKSGVPAGNIRILRSFIAQVFERGGSFHAQLWRFRDEFGVEFKKRWEKMYDVRYPELRRLRKEKYLAIFDRLESEQASWQAALCIRLFFEFHSPLSRVMGGRWDQVDGDFWYPYGPNEKVLWYESRERVGSVTRSLLDKISNLVKREFGDNPFWFPARPDCEVRSIRSVEPMWRKALMDCRIQYYPLLGVCAKSSRS